MVPVEFDRELTRAGGVRNGLRPQPITRFSQLSLTSQFGLVATIILGCGMAVLGSWVTTRIEDGVLKNSASAAALYTHSFIEPHLQVLADQSELLPQSIAALDSIVANPDRIFALKVWGQGGRIIYSSRADDVGKTFPVSARLKSAWAGEVEAEFNALDDEENEIERRFGIPLMEVYLPIRAFGSDRVIAVAEIYTVSDHLLRDLGMARLQSWLMVALLTLIMLVSLFGIVQRGSRTIRDQQDALKLQVSELSELLAQNKELQYRIAEANRRAEASNERFLRRIGAELHDGPAQLIGLALLRLDALLPFASERSESQKSPVFEAIRSALADALKEIRILSAGLALPELENASLKDVLQTAVRNHERRTGSTVECELSPTLPLSVPAPLTTCLYRFVQEGLNNAYRHAGGLGQVLSATFHQQVLEVQVRDAGSGIDPASRSGQQTGLGLAWLNDRIESLGGELEIASKPGAGTKLIARFRI